MNYLVSNGPKMGPELIRMYQYIMDQCKVQNIFTRTNLATLLYFGL